MLALDPQFAVLAAQCMLALVALPSPATGIVLRSHHSTHREVSGGIHHQRQRQPVIPAPEGKKRHPSTGERDSPFAHKASEKRDLSAGSQHAELLARSPSPGTPADPGGTSKKIRDQKVFQARDSPITGTIDGLVDPLLKGVDGTIKSVLGSDAIAPLLVGRRHHDHYFHDHDGDNIIIYDDGRSHFHIHQRSFLEHTRRPSKRAQDGISGIVDIVRNNTRLASLVVERSDDSYILNAAGSNATVLRLVNWAPAVGSPSIVKKSVEGILATLQLQMPDPRSTNLEEYCATFDPDPPTAERMSMEPCTPQSTEHKSQVFSYDADSGSLQPMHSVGDTVAPTANADYRNTSRGDDDLAEAEKVRVMTRGLGDLDNKVKLVFVPSAPEVKPGLKAYSPPSPEAAQMSTTTVTVTETVTQADSPTAADTESSPTTTAGQSPPEAFDVEVELPSTTSSSASPGSSNDNSTLSDDEPSSSPDPDAVAASIATGDASSSETTTASEMSSYPTPASLLVQVTPQTSLSTSTGSVAAPTSSA